MKLIYKILTSIFLIFVIILSIQFGLLVVENFDNNFRCDNKFNNSGTSADPLKISNTTQFNCINNEVNSNIILTNNITYEGDEDFSNLPIGTESNPFNGSIDGKGYIIKNMNLTKKSVIGYNDGNISNITFNNITIENETTSLIDNNRGTVRNVTVNGKYISLGVGSGGIVNKNNGDIVDSKSNVNISGEYRIGGIASINNERIVNCTSEGDIQSEDGEEIGGLVGVNYNLIIDSKANGDVNGFTKIGGLVGVNENTGLVINSSANNSVSGEFNFGEKYGVNNVRQNN